MSSIIGAVTGGGGKGVGYTAQGADIISPVTDAQAQAAQGQSLDALKQQQAFLAATQAQNGLGNQTNVYNQMQGVANGTGPNPAQAMLNNATGANVANQAAMMAAQRGSGANAGMIARQAGMQGANTQQQSAGQGAALQAQQSLGALGQMGGIAGQQAQQQAAATGANTNANQAQQQMLLNSIQGVNNANVGMQSNMNNANGAMQGLIAKGQMDLMGQVMGGAGKAFMMAEGGEVGTPQVAQAGKTQGPLSKFGQYIFNTQEASAPKDQFSEGASALGSGIGSLMSKGVGAMAGPGTIGAGFADGGNIIDTAMKLAPLLLANGGNVPALLSPGEQYLPPQAVDKVKNGADPLSVGEKIPGQPKHPGNDYRNDTVPKTLKEGGLVIPNEVMQAKNPHQEAYKFVNAHLAKNGKANLKRPK